MVEKIIGALEFHAKSEQENKGSLNRTTFNNRRLPLLNLPKKRKTKSLLLRERQMTHSNNFQKKKAKS